MKIFEVYTRVYKRSESEFKGLRNFLGMHSEVQNDGVLDDLDGQRLTKALVTPCAKLDLLDSKKIAQTEFPNEENLLEESLPKSIKRASSAD